MRSYHEKFSKNFWYFSLVKALNLVTASCTLPKYLCSLPTTLKYFSWLRFIAEFIYNSGAFFTLSLLFSPKKARNTLNDSFNLLDLFNDNQVNLLNINDTIYNRNFNGKKRRKFRNFSFSSPQKFSFSRFFLRGDEDNKRQNYC